MTKLDYLTENKQIDYLLNKINEIVLKHIHTYVKPKKKKLYTEKIQ